MYKKNLLLYNMLAMIEILYFKLTLWVVVIDFLCLKIKFELKFLCEHVKFNPQSK